MKKFIFLLFLCGCSFLFCSEKIDISFEYPDINGDFYVSGTAFFPPSSVFSSDHILVMDMATKKEVPSKITVSEKWPDGSILSAEIIFPANTSKKTHYAIFYGNEIKRSKIFSEPAVLPTVDFFTGGTGRTAENIDVNVGQINVRVDKSISIRYWWYVLPLLVLIFLTVYRSLTINRRHKSE
jgi:hypothetical protein